MKGASVRSEFRIYAVRGRLGQNEDCPLIFPFAGYETSINVLLNDALGQ